MSSGEDHFEMKVSYRGVFRELLVFMYGSDGLVFFRGEFMKGVSWIKHLHMLSSDLTQLKQMFGNEIVQLLKISNIHQDYYVDQTWLIFDLCCWNLKWCK